MIGCCFYISLCSLWIKKSFLIIFIIECITPYKKRIDSEDFSDLSCEQWKWRCNFYQACYSFTVGPHSSVHYHPKKNLTFLHFLRLACCCNSNEIQSNVRLNQYLYYLFHHPHCCISNQLLHVLLWSPYISHSVSTPVLIFPHGCSILDNSMA